MGEMLCKFTKTETREQTGFKQRAGAARLFSEIWAEEESGWGGMIKVLEEEGAWQGIQCRMSRG